MCACAARADAGGLCPLHPAGGGVRPLQTSPRPEGRPMPPAGSVLDSGTGRAIRRGRQRISCRGGVEASVVPLLERPLHSAFCICPMGTPERTWGNQRACAPPSATAQARTCAGSPPGWRHSTRLGLGGSGGRGHPGGGAGAAARRKKAHRAKRYPTQAGERGRQPAARRPTAPSGRQPAARAGAWGQRHQTRRQPATPAQIAAAPRPPPAPASLAPAGTQPAPRSPGR
jgi:hypothetical protein